MSAINRIRSLLAFSRTRLGVGSRQLAVRRFASKPTSTSNPLYDNTVPASSSSVVGGSSTSSTPSVSEATGTLEHMPTSHPDPQTEDQLVLRGKQYEYAILGSFPDVSNVGDFGTMERPTLVYSGGNERIVGCVGGGDVKHRLYWFPLKSGKKHVCRQCGQVFKLVNDDNYHEVEHLVDQRTRDHYEFYKTLQQKAGQTPTAVTVPLGEESKF